MLFDVPPPPPPIVSAFFAPAPQVGELLPSATEAVLRPIAAPFVNVLQTADDDTFAWQLENDFRDLDDRIPRDTRRDLLEFVVTFDERQVPPAADTLGARAHGLANALRVRRSVITLFRSLRAVLRGVIEDEVSQERVNQVFLSFRKASEGSDVPLALVQSTAASHLGAVASFALLADLTAPPGRRISPTRATYLVDLVEDGARHVARLAALATGNATLDVAKLGVFSVEAAYLATDRARRQLWERAAQLPDQ